MTRKASSLECKGMHSSSVAGWLWAVSNFSHVKARWFSTPTCVFAPSASTWKLVSSLLLPTYPSGKVMLNDTWNGGSPFTR
eukprot:CAMPEP_0181460674 /NCGR_PEP_ID=MMETSP1110-20121109/33468_1 /TAXON_ID=174948 /ORGANISM="Symbiodinium sp., Strain CCMP421" /LENGTH=80 /DNA_ID=CAMNT_0023585243 /DNA_START=568 /DNA_END=810 /DNA_ORIENTATION=-